MLANINLINYPTLYDSLVDLLLRVTLKFLIILETRGKYWLERWAGSLTSDLIFGVRLQNSKIVSTILQFFCTF